MRAGPTSTSAGDQRASEPRRRWRHLTAVRAPQAAPLSPLEYVDLLLVDDPTELREAVKRVLVDEVRITRSFIGSELRRGKWLGRLDLSLKFSTTVLAAAAAIGAAGTVGAWFTLVTAGAAALLSGFQTAFNPGPNAQAVMGLEA